MPAPMSSRTMRRTAMMPPVSPSIITGIETPSAIRPAIVTHSVILAATVRRSDR
jgi:hypothetical protein